METKITDRSYKNTVELVKFIFTISNTPHIYPLVDQLLRASTSVSANIFEAQGAASKKDFTNFYHIAFKSAVETKFWLNLLKDTSGIDKTKTDYFLKET